MANTDIDLNLSTPAENEKMLSYVIDWKQFVNNAPDGETTGDTQTYRLFQPRTGTIVRGVYAIIEEDFAGIGASGTVIIGDNNDADGFLTSKSLFGFAETARAQEGDGAFFQSTDTTSSAGGTDDVTISVTTAKNKIYSYDEDATTTYVTATFTPVAGKLGSATAGRIRILVDAIFANTL